MNNQEDSLLYKCKYKWCYNAHKARKQDLYNYCMVHILVNCNKDIVNSYSASHDNWCTGTLWNRVIIAQCEGFVLFIDTWSQ